MIQKQLKPKKCSQCRHEFIPFRSTQKVCGIECARKLAEKKREKVEKAKDRLRKEALKTRSDWMKEAQQAFNSFIRLRDQLAGHLCISSGRPLDWSGNNVDAGHYRSVGSAPHLRFTETNCHAQSKQDNRYKAGNAVDYRIGLIQRIGLEEVEKLESDQTPRKWTIDELKEIKETYKRKLKELEAI